MTSGWASVIVAAVLALAALYGFAVRSGRREGKVDEVLARLVTITERHDDDIRELQRSTFGPGPAATASPAKAQNGHRW